MDAVFQGNLFFIKLAMSCHYTLVQHLPASPEVVVEEEVIYSWTV